MKRRRFVETGLLAGAGATLGVTSEGQARAELKGNIKHSVCQWPYSSMPLADLVANAAEIGLKSVELLGVSDWKVVQDAGLTCAMAYAETLDGKNALLDGFNDPANHEWLIPNYEQGLRDAAEAGLPNLICFSGNRRGLNDQVGMRNCAAGLRQIIPLAEQLGVTVCMELLNSRVDHPDYQCDKTEWGVSLVDMVGSGRFKLLYDIYHMQIMEGDVIRTIRTYSEYIGHYHTGGNPGRNEIDDSQELNYPAIMEAILATGFEGYVAQEFIPTRDPMTSLSQCVEICDV